MRLRLLYWIPTAVIAMVMASGGLIDALQTDLRVFRHLGYPDYFSTILGVAQLLGVVALLAPVPRMLRAWAYAGFTFDVGGAILSIIAVGDPPSHLAIPLLAFAMLQLSYFAWRRREQATSGTPLTAPSPMPA
jgi:hypothetical protein